MVKKPLSLLCVIENSLDQKYIKLELRGAPRPSSQCQCLPMLVTIHHVSHNPYVSHNLSCLSQPRMLVTIHHVSHNPSCWSQPPMLVTAPHVSHNPSCQSLSCPYISHNSTCQSHTLMLVTSPNVSHKPSCQSQPLLLFEIML